MAKKGKKILRPVEEQVIKKTGYLLRGCPVSTVISPGCFCRGFMHNYNNYKKPGTSGPAGREEAGPDGEGFNYLVNNTKLQSGFVLQRYLLSEIAGEILPGSRCAQCRKALIPGKGGVAVIYSKAHQRASYGNLMTCGSIWLCAVCAAKISELRRVELVQATSNHTGGLALVTFTVRHKKTDKLSDTLKLLDFSFEKSFEGRWWQEFKARWGYIGKVTGLEITYGLHGWHPHKHCLFFFESQVSKETAVKIQKELTDRYLYLVEKAGGSALRGLGVDVRRAEKNIDIVSEYIAKFDRMPESPYWGVESELTKGYVKKTKAGGMTFWELLKCAAMGEKEAISLVREYATALRGKSSLRYSRGLKERLKVAPATDKELSDQPEKDGVQIAILVKDIWRQVCAKRLRGQLLEAAGTGLIGDILKFLVENGILPWVIKSGYYSGYVVSYRQHLTHDST